MESVREDDIDERNMCLAEDIKLNACWEATQPISLAEDIKLSACWEATQHISRAEDIKLSACWEATQFFFSFLTFFFAGSDSVSNTGLGVFPP